ncbi:MAG: DUF4115 domain-containing protein [Sideroxydans sp.]|nr:DUF4115 domain-containing protein [Sideroxydans sp.]
MMNEQPDNVQETNPAAAENRPPFSIGATLREAREGMGLSVHDVVNRLKFAPRQIKALEDDDFAQLPEAAFVRGFVRSYARLLQLDEAPLLAALPDAHAQDKTALAGRQSVEVPFPSVYSLRKSNIIWLSAALIVALALGLFTWLYDKEEEKQPRVESLAVPLAAVPVSAVPAVAPAATPAAAPPAVTPPVPAPVPVAEPPHPKLLPPRAAATPGMIRMTFDEDSWVEVKDKNGQVLMSQINPAGSEQNLNGEPPFTLTIGHAGGVKLYYKGKPVDLAPNTNVDVAHLTLE